MITTEPGKDLGEEVLQREKAGDGSYEHSDGHTKADILPNGDSKALVRPREEGQGKVYCTIREERTQSSTATRKGKTGSRKKKSSIYDG
jgi:hypothetical protein